MNKDFLKRITPDFLTMVTPEQMEKFKAGLEASIGVDAEGAPHISVPNMLAAVEIPDTPENRAVMSEILLDVLLSHNPEIQIVCRSFPDGNNDQTIVNE